MSGRLGRALTAFRRAAANRGGGLRGGIAVVVRAVSVVRALGWRGLKGRLDDAARAAQPRTSTDAVPRPAPLPLAQCDLRVGVMLHLFHVDLLEDFREQLAHIPVPFTLLVSVPDQDAAGQVRTGFAGLQAMHALDVRIVANRGRDWAPLLVDFRDQVRSLDLVCHLHSKKSLYTGRRRDDWRGYLLQSLLGSPTRVAWILGMFQADPRLGLVYPETFEAIPPWAHSWLQDAALGAEFAGRLGFDIDADASFDYPLGSMFWIRVDALRPLLDLDLSSNDFPVESGQTDGTLQHALERLVAPATLHHGYRLGILPTDGTLAMADEGERNWRQALSGTLEQRYRLAAAGIDRISVDLFDTLLLRPFLSPAGFHDYLKPGYAAVRRQAEQAARLSEGRDPDLDAIHRALARLRPDLPVADLQQLEKDTDARLLQLRPALASLLEGETRPVVALSDTYYHAPELRGMLPPALQTRIGEVRASCDTGERKDTGDAWRRIAADPGNDPARWLHVGDNACSDVQLPQDLGFRPPLHVLRPASLLETVPALRPLHPGAAAGIRWQDSLWLGLVANRLSRLADESPDCFSTGFVLPDAATLGYIAVGPLVHDFVAWVAREALHGGNSDLLFLAREGWLLEQCFNRLAATTPRLQNVRGHYFLASRRATGLASLGAGDDHAGDNLARLFAGTFTGPLADLLRARLGVEAAALAETRGLDRGMAYLPGMSDDIAQRLQPLLPELLAMAEAERDAYRGYFGEIVGNNESTPVAVDIGYSATIQSHLARLLDRPVQGAYMALKASAMTTPSSSAARHFDGRRGDDPETSPILRNDLLLESLLTAPAAQLSHFQRDSAGRIVPRFVAGTEPPDPGLVAQVHAGALAFVDDLHRVVGEDALDVGFDPHRLQVPLACIGQGRWQLGPWSSALGVDDHYSGRGMVSPIS